METFSGMVKIHPQNDQKHFTFVDAFLKGIGAIKSNKVYAMKLSNKICEILSIVHLEAPNILVALTYWAEDLTNEECIIWCDNQAVVVVFSSHKTKDSFLMACVRTAWLICANNNVKLQVKHVRGSENVYADILSR